MEDRITKLILSRSKNESVCLSNMRNLGDIRITVVEVNQWRAKIAIEAPESVKILREELLDRKGCNDEVES